MKRVLYGTSALVAAGLLAGAPAGMAADKVKVGIGGYFQGFVLYGSQDDGAGEPGANLRDHKIAREAELIFAGRTTLDNGVMVGIEVQLEAETCADQIDESFVYLQGGFGRLQIGSDDSAPNLMAYGAPTPIPGHGVNSPTFQHPAFGANAVASPITLIAISGDSEKLTYFTPRIAGIQFGLSYTPDNCQENNPAAVGGATPCGGSYGGLQAQTNAGQQSEIIEIGANYVTSFGGLEVAVYGGLGAGSIEAGTPATEDQNQWGLGFQFGYQALTVGGSYRRDDQGLAGANTDRHDYNIGISYALDDWTLAAAYAHTQVEAGAAGGEDELDQYEIGARYRIGPGVELAGGVQYYDLQDNLGAPGNENEALMVLLGTNLTF